MQLFQEMSKVEQEEVLNTGGFFQNEDGTWRCRAVTEEDEVYVIVGISGTNKIVHPASSYGQMVDAMETYVPLAEWRVA